MKRGTVLGALVVAGTLSLGVKAYQPPAADAPKVVTVEKVKDNLYVLRGENGGGNTAVFVTANGVTVVDAKNPGWGKPILDKIKELTPKPVTTLINTHTHGDHVSGNVEFPATIDFVAQENTKVNMEKMPIFKEHNNVGIPKRTFKDKMTIGSGADQVDLYYFGRGHTNGDAWIVFPALRVVHSGDIFAGKSVPLIDDANGGSMMEISDSLLKAYNGIKNVDTIITGHSNTTMKWDDLKEYADFNRDFLSWVRSQQKAGKSADQAAGEYKVPDKFKGYTANLPPFFGGMKGYIQSIYDEK